jgi:hypothetical protein
MNKYLSLIIILIVTAFLAGCNQQIGDYTVASSISENGFARDETEMLEVEGQEVKIWGFVDHANMYGDEGAKGILEEWWSGDGPSATTWRFNLKAREDDEAGQSFPVHVPNDEGRDDLLKAFAADARAQKPTKVFVKGKIFRFDAPTNVIPRTGLYMELESSYDILLEPSEVRRQDRNRGNVRERLDGPLD